MKELGGDVLIGETARHHRKAPMSEVKFETYELRGGSTSLPHTKLIQEIEAASAEDVRAYAIENYPGQDLWIINKSRNTRPFMLIAVKLGPAISANHR
jgi:hypothetical protein